MKLINATPMTTLNDLFGVHQILHLNVYLITKNRSIVMATTV